MDLRLYPTRQIISCSLSSTYSLCSSSQNASETSEQLLETLSKCMRQDPLVAMHHARGAPQVKHAITHEGNLISVIGLGIRVAT